MSPSQLFLFSFKIVCLLEFFTLSSYIIYLVVFKKTEFILFPQTFLQQIIDPPGNHTRPEYNFHSTRREEKNME